MARNVIESGKIGRQISQDEALDIMQKNQDDGLVLQPTNSQTPDAICSCCGCCCGPLRLHKAFPDPVSHWATNFHAAIDPELCTGCGLCEERCQVGALKLDEARQMMVVDLARCLGCGLCVEACPEGVIELRNRTTQVIPPRTVEDMMEVIMTNKS
jgi:Na+-translocating ferredoxin:NAD+ oxidoreductase subunit B